MNFDRLKTPCKTCPFRVGTSISLHPGRCREIRREVLNPDGKSFSCHSTNVYGGDDAVEERDHCAGALAFAEKLGFATQPMRIAERLGIYDARLAVANAGEVFDSPDDWESHMTRHDRASKKRKGPNNADQD